MSNKILLPQLVSTLSSTTGKPKKQIESFLKSFFLVIADTLEKHESVKIKGLGTFKVNRIEARKSVDVSSGEEVKIPAHYRVVFSPAKTLAEKVNEEFAWLEVIEISDNVSNSQLDHISTDAPDEKTGKSKPVTASKTKSAPIQAPVTIPEPEPIPVPEQEPEPIPEPEPVPKEIPEPKPEPTAVAIPKEEIAPTENKGRDDGEKLGEELEKEFGEIEPTEPFGPIEPDDPAPDQPIPENKKLNADFDFDFFDSVEKEQQKEKPKPASPFYITKDEYDSLAGKAELKILNKNVKKIRATVERYDERNRKRSRNYFLWSIFISLILATGCFFLVYYLLDDKINNSASAQLEQNDSLNPDSLDDEYAPTTVQGFSNAETTESADVMTSDAAPGIRGTDKVTSTRFLTTMALDYYGSYHYWPYIYLENQDRLSHPDRITPGTEVVIPDIAKYDVDPSHPRDLQKAKRLGVEIYKNLSH